MKSFTFPIVVVLFVMILAAHMASAASIGVAEPAPAFTGNRQSPRLGRIELGAFAPEAALKCGITDPCLCTFDNIETYNTYRQAIRAAYGANLSDMNYLGIGRPGWRSRYEWLKDWLFRASQFGDPTIALEPSKETGYSVFQDSPEMQCLRVTFEAARQAGINVWVRFASESNDVHNPYSILGSPQKIAQYRQAVHWFHAYMPSNVHLVFSPLLDDFITGGKAQMPTLRSMYVPGDYDRIGGTLYATTWVSLEPAYSWYYDYMRKLDPNTRFQICELGGIFEKQHEIYHFLQTLKSGKWPKVDRVNFFAGELNPTAIRNHGHFGLVLPGQTASYLRSLIAADNSEPPVMVPVPSARLATSRTDGPSHAASLQQLASASTGETAPTSAIDLSSPIFSKQAIPPELAHPRDEAVSISASPQRLASASAWQGSATQGAGLSSPSLMTRAAPPTMAREQERTQNTWANPQNLASASLSTGFASGESILSSPNFDRVTIPAAGTAVSHRTAKLARPQTETAAPIRLASALLTSLPPDPSSSPIAAPTAPVAMTTDLGADWKSADMTLKGTTIAASATYRTFVLMVTDVTTSSGEHIAISPARKKRVYLQPNATITTPTGAIDRSQLASLKGAVTQVTGWDQGSGTALMARSVVVSAE